MTAAQMVVNRLPIHAEPAGGLGDGHERSIDAHRVIGPCVVLLLTLCGPAHISGLVVPVRVDPVQAVLATRASADIVEKGRKRRPPCVADRDATRSVYVVSARAGVVASPPHILPRNVFRRPPTDRASTVLPALFIVPASAGYLSPIAQDGTFDCRGATALAAAQPFAATSKPHHRQAPECGASQVATERHFYLSLPSNALAYLLRREGHLARNVVLYAALTAVELTQVARHLGAMSDTDGRV